MAFTVQDDNGSVDNANSYVSVADFESYCSDRGYDLSSYTTIGKQQALVKATDYIDGRYQYKGYQISSTQGTKFPRSFNGLAYVIPDDIKKAQYEAAFWSIQGNDLFSNATYQGNLSAEKKKVDVLEVEYKYNYSGTGGYSSLPFVTDLLLESGWITSSNVLIRS